LAKASLKSIGSALVELPNLKIGIIKISFSQLPRDIGRIKITKKKNQSGKLLTENGRYQTMV
jgi:hypothetical protein